MKITEDILKTMIRKIIKEEFENTSSDTQYTGGYVLIDDYDQALIGNYSPNDMQSAIEDARKMAEVNPRGSYRVCGSDENNQYDYDDTCVFSTLDEGKQRIRRYIKENIKDIVNIVIKEEQKKHKKDGSI